jgi:uncharacterized protein
MIPWQEACERAVNDFSRHDSLRFWGWGHSGECDVIPPFDYRFEHTLAVVKLGYWLAPLVAADEDILVCAAWLHDCRKRLGAEGPDMHAAEAADAVEAILDGTDFPAAKIPAVRHAILHHVGLKLEAPLDPLETACLWDIDKLSKIGGTGIVHFLAITPAFQQTTTATLLEKSEDWLELAQGIADSMNTAPAKLEAAKRVNFLRLFYGQVRNEWTGN